MREFICGFRQSVLLEIGITESELNLVIYFIRLFESGCAYVKKFDGELFFMVSASKVLEDMPFVVKSERRFRELLLSMDKKGIIKRKYMSNCLYIFVCFDLLNNGKSLQGGEQAPSEQEIAAQYCDKGGDMSPTIIKYIKNKIYIYYNLNKKARFGKIEEQDFFKKLKQHLFETMSEASYGVCISKAELRCLSPRVIVLDVKEAMPAVKKYHTKAIEDAINKVLESYAVDFVTHK